MAAEPLQLPNQHHHIDETASRSLWAGGQFAAVYREHFDRLRRFCLGLTGDEALAEDVAQETLLRAYLKMTSFDLSRPLWPWLKCVARRLIVDHARRARFESLSDEPVDVPIDDETAVAIERDALGRALGALPVRQRVALALRYMDDWDTADVARALTITKPALDQLLFRARRRLTDEYARISDEVSTRVRVVLWPLFFAGAWLRERAAKLRQLLVDSSGLSASAAADGVSHVMAAVAIGSVLIAGGVAAAAPHAGSRTSDTATQASHVEEMRRRPVLRVAAAPQRQARPQRAAAAPARARTVAVEPVVTRAAAPDDPEVSHREIVPVRERTVQVAPAPPVDRGPSPKAKAGTKRGSDGLVVDIDAEVDVDEDVSDAVTAETGLECSGGSAAVATACDTYDAVDAELPS